MGRPVIFSFRQESPRGGIRGPTEGKGVEKDLYSQNIPLMVSKSQSLWTGYQAEPESPLVHCTSCPELSFSLYLDTRAWSRLYVLLFFSCSEELEHRDSES